MHKKKILFVSYGGGHIEIVKSIIEDCIDFDKYDVELLALTVSYDVIRNPKVRKYRISDFEFLFKEHLNIIKSYGNMLYEDNYSPHANMSKNEVLFYLGLSYYDLVNEFGEELAFVKYKEKKRQAFNPKVTLKKIIEYISPNFLFTTNSPRMEAAAIYAARQLHVPSIQILDLFGDDYPVPTADNIIVMNEFVRNKLLNSGIKKNIIALGQPIFDKTLEEVEKVNKEHVLNKLGYNTNDRIALFCPTPYYLWNEDLSLKGIGEESKINTPIFNILSDLIINFGIKIILRPHPVSDNIENYRKYLDKLKSIKYFNNNELNLFESLSISESVIVYNSTIAVQAAVCNKTVFTYNYDINQKYLWDNYMREPFIYSNKYDTLNKNLNKHYSKKIDTNSKQKFYELGAKERIFKYINEVLWNS
jgi:hypothetical protein